MTCFWLKEKSIWLIRQKGRENQQIVKLIVNGREVRNFCKTTEPEWPIQTNSTFLKSPESASALADSMKNETKKDSLPERSGIERYSWYSKLIQDTARIVSAYNKIQTTSFKNELKRLDVKPLKHTE